LLSKRQTESIDGMNLNEIYLLLQQAKAGDVSAENRLFDHLSGRFGLFLRIRTRDAEIARDIAQEACATIFAKYKAESFSSAEGFLMWAFRIHLMKLGNYFKKATRERKRVVSAAECGSRTTFHAKSDEIDLKRRLIDCLKRVFRVNQRYGRILLMKCHGYSTNEICSRLGLRPNILYTTLNRARNMLKRCLDAGEI